MGTKNLKGTVSIEIIGERIRLRWRFQKRRFSLNLFQFTKANLLKAKVIAVNIERDLDSDHFDPCLDRYKPLQVQESFSQTITLVTYFEDWVRNYRNMSCDRDIDYYSIRSMMLRWGDFDSSTVMQHFNKETFSPRTYNRRLTILKAFFNWTKKTNLTSGNPLEDVLPKKVRKTEKPNREPFTIAEIRMLLKKIHFAHNIQSSNIHITSLSYFLCLKLE
ncbi:MAG: DUF3596 domain-containing protein [Chitinophagaceae bacterium]|nr:DUF3596 domain-containing protein [Chitinophagaceae bacterium]